MIYESHCHVCNIYYEYQASIDNHSDAPTCTVCGNKTKQCIRTAPVGFVKGGGAADFQPFKGVDGTVIDSQLKLDEHMRKHNLVNLHEGYSEDKILAGDLKPKVDKKKVGKEIKEDTVAALKKVEAGYVPEKIIDNTIEVQQ